MNNKLLVLIGALLISLNTNAAEVKKPECKITDEMKLAITVMCSLEPNTASCESEAIKTLEQEYNCKAGE